MNYKEISWSIFWTVSDIKECKSELRAFIYQFLLYMRSIHHTECNLYKNIEIRIFKNEKFIFKTTFKFPRKSILWLVEVDIWQIFKKFYIPLLIPRKASICLLFLQFVSSAWSPFLLIHETAQLYLQIYSDSLYNLKNQKHYIKNKSTTQSTCKHY